MLTMQQFVEGAPFDRVPLSAFPELPIYVEVDGELRELARSRQGTIVTSAGEHTVAVMVAGETRATEVVG